MKGLTTAKEALDNKHMWFGYRNITTNVEKPTTAWSNVSLNKDGRIRLGDNVHGRRDLVVQPDCQIIIE